MLRTIQGYVDVTVRVPFTVLDDAEDITSSTQDWADMVNAGITPDAMEGAQMDHANSAFHEVVGWEIAEAWTATPEHDHSQRCCTNHAIHVNPHRGCILR